MSDLENRTRYEPSEAEPRVFERWEASGRFHPEPTGSPEDNYSIAIPPPNVTGALHMGHALNGSIQDALIRHAPHAGPQHEVDPRHRPRRHRHPDPGRAARSRPRARARRSSGARSSSSACGSGATSTAARSSPSTSGSAPRSTTRTSASRSTTRYVRAVLKVFVDLYEKGLIYRDNYMVNWDPGSRLGDLRPRGRGARGRRHALLRSTTRSRAAGSVTIATVRPETMLADTAIAVHPDDDRYTRLVGETAILPLVGRRLKIIADPYVKPEFGTGALKITPGHDPNDFEIGRAHGLEEISVIGEDGRMTEAAGERFAGMTALEAREAVVDGAARGGPDRAHRALHARRPVLAPLRRADRAADLAAVVLRMDELAAPAIEVVRDGRVRIHPEGQRPALPRLAGEHPALVHLAPAVVGPPDPRLVPRRGDLRAGSSRREGDGWEQDPDVLDTWFSLGAVAVRDARLARATRRSCARSTRPTCCSTARDIIFLWVARMIMFGLEFAGDIPFERRLRPLDHPGARRAADVEVARHRDRPARPDRGRPAPARLRAGRRLPRLRRRRGPLRPAGDVLLAGRALQRGQGRPGPPARQQALERVAAGAAARADDELPEPRAVTRRGPLDPVAAAARQGGDASGRSRTSSSTAPRSGSTTSSTATCATGTSS